MQVSAFALAFSQSASGAGLPQPKAKKATQNLAKERMRIICREDMGEAILAAPNSEKTRRRREPPVCLVLGCSLGNRPHIGIGWAAGVRYLGQGVVSTWTKAIGFRTTGIHERAFDLEYAHFFRVPF